MAADENDSRPQTSTLGGGRQQIAAALASLDDERGLLCSPLNSAIRGVTGGDVLWGRGLPPRILLHANNPLEGGDLPTREELVVARGQMIEEHVRWTRLARAALHAANVYAQAADLYRELLADDDEGGGRP